jgi:hypothetical protein
MLPNDRGQKLTGGQLIEALKQACADGSTVISDDFSGYKVHLVFLGLTQTDFSVYNAYINTRN